MTMFIQDDYRILEMPYCTFIILIQLHISHQLSSSFTLYSHFITCLGASILSRARVPSFNFITFCNHSVHMLLSVGMNPCFLNRVDVVCSTSIAECLRAITVSDHVTNDTLFESCPSHIAHSMIYIKFYLNHVTAI